MRCFGLFLELVDRTFFPVFYDHGVNELGRNWGQRRIKLKTSDARESNGVLFFAFHNPAGK
jgi:hypothetical protein